MQTESKMQGKVKWSERDGRLMVYAGYSVRIFLSPMMLDYLRRHYAETPNGELCGELGVSQRTMRRKAAELGLEKSAAYMMAAQRSAAQMARVANRNGNAGFFKKGHQGGAQFRKGMKRTAEQQAKITAGIRRAWSMDSRRKREQSERMKAFWQGAGVRERIGAKISAAKKKRNDDTEAPGVVS